MLCFDLDRPTPDALRGESIRAVRGLARSPASPVGRAAADPPRWGLLHAVADMLHELGQALAAISGAMADGIDIAAGRSDAAHAQPAKRTRLVPV